MQEPFLINRQALLRERVRVRAIAQGASNLESEVSILETQNSNRLLEKSDWRG
jgi:hypothetical protein